MTAPDRIWHITDRKGKVSTDPDAHVMPCDGAKDAYDEYIRADLVPTWQPIETAPNDGTEILITDGDFTCFGCFYLREWVFCNGVETSEDGVDLFGLNKWIAGYGSTHWMPLPTTPETAQ